MATPPHSLPAGVLIIGAGPTGLTLAISLAAHGVPFVIVDRKDGPCVDSKALAVNIASQYAFELLGLGKRLGTRAGHLRKLNVLWQGKRISAVDVGRLDFHLRSFLAQPQADTEQELIDTLAHFGHRVDWRVQVKSVVQDDTGVTVTMEGAEGEEETRRYAYAVGCEGKNSLVRQQIANDFSGVDYPVYFVVGDFALDWDRPRDQGYYYVYEHTFFIILPVGRDGWRVVVRHDGALPQDKPLTSAEITDVVSRELGRNIFMGEASWISRAPFYMRVSDRLQQGRLFIAGDAAHLFSPIGGTGMNTGMQDALNLGWKLAYRTKGLAGDALLATYEAERLEAIRATAAATDRSTRLITRIDRDPAAVQSMMPLMRNRPAFRAALPILHSGLGPSSVQALGEAGGAPMPGSRRAGEYCLGLGEVRGAGDTPARLSILAWQPDPLGHPDYWRALEAITRRYPDATQTIVLVDDAATESELQRCFPALDAAIVNDTARRRSGLGAGGVLMVQPTGIVAYSGALADLDGLRAWLARYLQQAAERQDSGVHAAQDAVSA